MSEFQKKYKHLYDFFAGTFASPIPTLTSIQEIIDDDFTTFTGVGDLKERVDELNALIELNLSEEELKKILIDLGMWLSIDNDHWKPSSHTYKEWIVDLHDTLQKEYDRRTAK
jgi:phenylalanyl-tRNA synthetase beta subunit